MEAREYLIPGTRVEVLDYQVKSEPEKTPERAILILGDMPDQLVVSNGKAPDPLDPGASIKRVPFPANRPIVVDNPLELVKALKGENLVIDTAEDLGEISDTTNIMDLLKDVNVPIAVCKITLRNGDRPDLNNLHEKYEAIDFAYENLGNFPAGKIFPAVISYDEEFGNLYLCRTYELGSKVGDPRVLEAITIDEENFIPEVETTMDLSFNVYENDGLFYGKVMRGTDVLVEGLSLYVDGLDYRLTENTYFEIDEGVSASLNKDKVFGVGDGASSFNPQVLELFVDIASNPFYRISNLAKPELTTTDILVKEGEQTFKPKKAKTYVVELKENGDVFVNYEKKVTLEINGEKELINEKEMALDEGIEVILKRGAKFGELDNGETNAYKLNVVPPKTDGKKTDPVYRTALFCYELSKNLNDCRGFIGVKPAKNTSSEAIKEQINKLENLSKTRIGFEKYLSATDKIDLGMYVDAVVGSQRYNGIGGITGFPESRVLSVESKKITTDKSYQFEKGDMAEVVFYKRNKIDQQELKVAKVFQTEEYTEIIFNEEIKQKFDNPEQIYVRNINNKDSLGVYTAALYAVEAHKSFPMEAPINNELPGSAQIIYNRNQLIKLNNMHFTVINKQATSNRGYVVDTPTLARNESDFTDQATISLLLNFIKDMRSITNAKGGKRLNSSEEKTLLEDSVEELFEEQMGTTIEDYDLNFDYSLMRKQILLIDFAIRDIKTHKETRIQARLK